MPLCIFSAATYSLNLTRHKNKTKRLSTDRRLVSSVNLKKLGLPLYFSGGIVYDNRRCSVLQRIGRKAGMDGV